MTTDVGALAERLDRQFKPGELRVLADSFSYRRGDIPPLHEVYRDNGRLTLTQAFKIVAWKTERQSSLFKLNNSDEVVQLITGFAATAAGQLRDSPQVAASILISLPHVHYPTASAILTVWNPDEYGIIDFRSWSALHRLTKSGEFDRGQRTLFTAGEFSRYIQILRAWRDQCNGELTVRDIDKALWQYDKEQSERSPTP